MAGVNQDVKKNAVGLWRFFFTHSLTLARRGVCLKHSHWRGGGRKGDRGTKYSVRKENVINCVCVSVCFCASTAFFYFLFYSLFIRYLFCFGRLLSICQFLTFQTERIIFLFFFSISLSLSLSLSVRSSFCHLNK